MLKSTFQHLKGIAKKGERKLWKAGIICWDDLILKQRYKQLPLFGTGCTFGDDVLAPSRRALAEENVEFFAKGLPRREYYRIALTFVAKTLFLDIETTGLSRYYDYITIIGWSMGSEYNFYIKGEDDSALRKALSEAKAIVTFNGSLFDIPFLIKEFQNLDIPSSHIDLRFFSRRMGISGGQKKIESLLGIERPAELAELDGREAPLLWYKYCRGDIEALRLLVAYNHADIVGLQKIFDAVVKYVMQEEEIPPHLHSIFRFSDHSCDLKLPLQNLQDRGGRIRPCVDISLIRLQDLVSSQNILPLRFVGIDLTGSETKPSGWCLLDGDVAHVQMVKSNSELIERILETKPLLVSIDSPLSLPKGRSTVSDADPGRDTYGIMRICERILKKRGINVYPSLIKSMQGLTARGIRLTESLRNLGVPVIESFPGAAQDIMRIPRKRAGLELLKQGLAEFGIRGDYLTNPVSHDELDAITSAIVGYFFWVGKFEALGNEDEEYLIIPDLSIVKSNRGCRTVIGLSGPIAAGKTTAGMLLKSLGFHYTRFSLVLEEILCKQGIEPNRVTLQRLGEELNKTPGQRWLCQQLVKSLPGSQDIVIDGLRHLEDHAYMVETFGPNFIHVYINSPVESCLERYVHDGRTREEFMKAIQHPVESNVSKLANVSHMVVPNLSSLEQYRATVTKILNQIRAYKRTDPICR